MHMLTVLSIVVFFSLNCSFFGMFLFLKKKFVAFSMFC